MKVDQAVRPLPPKSLNILVGLMLKLDSLCINVSVVENIWALRFVFRLFVLPAWKGLFWQGLAKCEDFVGNMAEIARNNVVVTS